MPIPDKPRKSPTKDPGYRIAWLRLARGLSQEDMARLTGIPLRTYLRIERREVQNPGIRHLTNIAIVLGLDPKKGGIAGLYDDDDDPLTWQVFNEDAKEPPAFPERYPGRFLHPDTYEWRSSQEAE